MHDINLRGNVLLQERSDNVGDAGVAHGVEMQAVALPEQVTRAGVSTCQWEVCCDVDERGSARRAAWISSRRVLKLFGAHFIEAKIG